MTPRIPYVLIVALLASASAHGGIYRHVDERGNTVFTDQPPDNAEAVELGPVNTLPGGVRSQHGKSAPEAAAPAYRSLQLTGVNDGDVLQNPEGAITVSASPDIPLQAGHRLFILHNGQAVTSGSDTVYVVPRIDRGAHTFSAEIQDATGAVLITSATASIQVHRSATPPARVRPR